jgi:hypothetical protein
MCVEVVIRRRDGSVTVASRKEELRDALGVDPVVDGIEYAGWEWNDDECLCPCDIEATAKEAGMSAHYECPDWIMEPLQAQEAEARG